MDGSPTAPSGVLKSSPALLAKSSTVTRLSSMASCATQKMRIDVHDSLVWKNEGVSGCWDSTSMYIKGLSSSLSTTCILHLVIVFIKNEWLSTDGVCSSQKHNCSIPWLSRVEALAYSIDDVVRIQPIFRKHDYLIT